MLKWKEEYSIGVEAIDEQHRHLFEIGNRAYAVLKDKMCTDKYDKMVEVLIELKDYTVHHFQTEEDYMLEIGYKKYFEQKVAHKNFVSKLEDYHLDRLDDMTDKEIEGVLSVVFEWVLEHILKEDMQIKNS